MKTRFISYLKIPFAVLLFFSLTMGINYSTEEEQGISIEMNTMYADGACGPSCKYATWNCHCGSGSSRSIKKFCKRAEAGSCTGGSMCSEGIRCYSGPKQEQ